MSHNGLEAPGNARKGKSNGEKHSEGKVLGTLSRKSFHSCSMGEVICKEED
jgi:hypothetical protein